MQVKKYRAATTREALEKIKLELGEDAFVLETKQVRTNGLFGFGAGTQIEVSAAAPHKNKSQEEKPKASVAAPSFLGLTDDALAKAVFSEKAQAAAAQDKKPAAEIFPALSARALVTNPLKTAPVFSKNGIPAAPAPLASNGIEISDEAPRIVHARKENLVKLETASAVRVDQPATQTAPTETATPASKTVENRQSTPSHLNYELERLRAEMREMKFALGAFSARQTNSFHQQPELAFDAPAELYDSPFYDAYLELTSSGLAPEAARDMICAMIPAGGDQFNDERELAYCALLKSLPSLVRFGSDPLAGNGQKILALVGATGVGKTTTLAKLAARVALRERRPVELVTIDTYRIAAVDQLRTYAEIIGAGFHIVRSILELDATLARLPKDATVLIDTTGRGPLDLADQIELADYLREREDIFKCLVMQATTHPVDAMVAAKKFALYGANCLTLTKMDETTRPGALVSVASSCNLPLVYICDGQRVPEDLAQATPDYFANQILPPQAVQAAA